MDLRDDLTEPQKKRFEELVTEHARQARFSLYVGGGEFPRWNPRLVLLEEIKKGLI